MLFSNQYSRRFLWPRLSVKPRQDLIAVTLRGFFTVSDRTQISRLSFQSELSLSECLLAQISQSSRYCTTIILRTPSYCLLVCFFYQRDKVSSQVPVAKDTTNKRADVLDATGRRWMKYSGQASSSSVSVAHVPMCVYRGTGSQPEHELDDGNKWRQPFVEYLHIYIKRKCFLKKTVLHFSLYCTPKTNKQKNTKRRCKLYSIPCFFSLSEKTFHYCPFTLDWLAN